MSYDIIKNNYDRGLWTKAMVEKAFDKGAITWAQYEEIISGKEEEGKYVETS